MRTFRGLLLTCLCVGCVADAREELVYVSVAGGDFEIVLSAVDDTVATNLSDDDALDYSPRWSWDGRHVFYYSNRSGDNEIYRVDPATGETWQVTEEPSSEISPSPGPDGRIAFVSDRDGNRELYLMTADGTDVRRLTENEHYDGGATWSPDGTMLAFSSSERGHGEIFILTLSTGDMRRLVSTDGHADSPDWSPDGTRIAFNVAADETVSIHVASVDGSQLTRVPNAHADERHARWSPDGSWLLYTATVAADPLDTDVWMMRPDGSERRPVIESPGRDEFAAWRPAR